MSKSHSLYIVDGSSFIFRAYHAIRSLTSAAGVPTNAVYGFGAMLMKLLTDKVPDLLVVVFDAKGPTFRNELYDQYKANRPPPPEDLVVQFSLIRELVRNLGVMALEQEGVEADDIIATLVGRAKDEGMHTTIVSSDKDLMGMTCDTVQLYDSMKERVYTPGEVEKKFGVVPELMEDLLALMGDSSDNIPGVPGIGQKTGAKLLNEFGSLEKVLEGAKKGKIKGKRGETLVKHAEDARLAKKLVKLRDDVSLDVKLRNLTAGPAKAGPLEELLRRLSFKRWLQDLDTVYKVYGKEESSEKSEKEDSREENGIESVQQSLFGSKKAAEVKRYIGKNEDKLIHRKPECPKPEMYFAVEKSAQLKELTAELDVCDGFAVDLETTGLDPVQARIVGVAVAVGPGKAWYIPVGHTTLEDQGKGLPMKEVLKTLKPYLEDEDLPVYGQNYKYDYVLFYREGIELAGIVCDPMIASYLLDPSEPSHGLDALAYRELNYKMIPYEQVCGKGRTAITFDKVSIKDATRYAAEDAEVTYILGKQLLARVKEEGLESLMMDVEIPLGRVLGLMEVKGIEVDRNLLADVSNVISRRLVELTDEVTDAGGLEVNINSPKQLQVLLFEHLGLKPIRKTKTGYSTDADVLEQLADQHPVAEMIHEYRTLAKLRSTYTEVLPRLINPETGRIHTSYNQAVAATGRLSSSEPNLQNIPIRTEIGRRIRRAFVAKDGCSLVSADYSQIELRVLAHLSDDPALVEAFRNDEDIHTKTASEVFGVSAHEVDSEMRRVAKAVNFGVIYGQSAFGLAKGLRIPRREAAQYIEGYFKHYTGVLSYMNRLIEDARCSGVVTTILGRRRPLPFIQGGGHRESSAAERMARNTPIQGSAADIIKLAMLRCQERLERDFVHAAMLLTVHDALIFEVPDHQAEVLAKEMKREMETVYKLSVPLKVDIGIGKNWEEAH